LIIDNKALHSNAIYIQYIVYIAKTTKSHMNYKREN